MKVNLIFDYNFFCSRARHGFDIKKYERGNGKLFDTLKTKQIFVQKLMKDFAYQIKQLEGVVPTNIFNTLDSSSWRKKLYKEYKGTRERDDNTNWDVYFQLIEQTSNLLQKNGTHNLKIDSAEADDIIYLLSETYMRKGFINIVITSDNDLKMLVKSVGGGHTIHFNVITEKIAVSEEFMEFLNGSTDSVDIFNMKMEDANIENIRSYINNHHCDVIDWRDVAFSKIFLKDTSDNIPNIFWGYGKKTHEKFANTYTKKELQTQLSQMIKSPQETAESLVQSIKKIKKLHKNVTEKECVEHIKLFFKLTYLNVKNLPKKILTLYKQTIKDIQKQNKKIKFDNLRDYRLILENTEFYNENAFNDDSVFNGIL